MATQPILACAMLRTLGILNLKIGQEDPKRALETLEGMTVNELVNQEQRVIVGLLTELLDRAPTDTEIQMATAG